MPISSRIEKSHGVDPGKGNAYGWQKQTVADGDYVIDVSGIHVVNHSGTSQDSAWTKLADGTSLATEVRAGSITIDSIGGEAALHLTTDSSNGRLRVNDAFDAAHQVRLADLGHVGFDYFIQSADRTDVIPVLRIALDADGNLATTNDRVELVFEWAYQGLGPTTPGSWQSADISGGDWRAWERANGHNIDFGPNFATLSTWESAAGFTPDTGIHVDGNSLVLGWSIADGSGNGTNSMFLDHLVIGAQTVNFA